MNIKGFTLVELLAVIVILAIVALVTAPAILNVINDSRLSGAKDKAWGTIDAIKLTFAQVQVGDVEIINPTVTFSANGNDSASSLGKALTMNGDKPIAGKVKINTTTGEITVIGLTFTGNATFTCSSNAIGTKMCCKSGSSAPTAEWCKSDAGKKQFENGDTLAS